MFKGKSALLVSLIVLLILVVTGCNNEITKYNLEVLKEGEGSVNIVPREEKYVENSSVTLTAVPADDWEFSHWEGDATGEDDEIVVVMDKDKIVTAVFIESAPPIPGEYDLRVRIEGQGEVEHEIIYSPDILFPVGTIIRLAAGAHQGWDFIRWEGDAQGTERTIEVTMDSDKDITAVFAKVVTVDVRIVGNGRVEIEPELASYPIGTEIKLTAIAADEWYFAHWKTDNETIEDDVLVMTLEEDLHMEAVFEREASEPPFDEGTGTPEDPYTINTPAQLAELKFYLDSHFVLDDNINLSDYGNWEPIGTWVGINNPANEPFMGSLDGAGHTITGLNINTEKEGIGLFGYLGEEAEIKNLTLRNVQITGTSIIGGLVAVNAGGAIDNCQIDGQINSSKESLGRLIGGIVGSNENGNIINSWFAGRINCVAGNTVGGLVGENRAGIIKDSFFEGQLVTGGGTAGGIVGDNIGGSILNSFAAGAVTGDTPSNGGLAGKNSNGGVIQNCYARVEVTGGGFCAGGLVGDNIGAESIIRESYAAGSVTGLNILVGGVTGRNTGVIVDCYAHGNVKGTNEVGGLVGRNSKTIANSYSIGEVEGDAQTGGLVGKAIGGTIEYSYYNSDTAGQNDDDKGIPKTTEEMYRQETYEPEWDFENIWEMEDGRGYPYLMQ